MIARAEVLVSTTWRCNLRCAYCFVEERTLEECPAAMPPVLARQVVDAMDEGLPDADTVCLHLYGGEPLTNLPALEAMVVRAEEKPAGRIAFAVTTNGTCLSERAIELLERGRFQVVLSIDGPAHIHDACRRTARGEPTHARVLDFLQALRTRTRCEVRGSSVVRSGWSLADAQSYLRELPVHAIKAQAVRAPEATAWALSPDERQTYLDDLDAIGDRVIEELETGEVPRDDRFSARVLQLLAGVEREAFCAAGDTTFGITPTGEVLPCVLLDGDGNRLGHVDGPTATWRRAGRRWRDARPMRSECVGCAARPLCGGGCPAILPICGADECDLIRRNSRVASRIYAHFEDRPETLLALAGIV